MPYNKIICNNTQFRRQIQIIDYLCYMLIYIRFSTACERSQNCIIQILSWAPKYRESVEYSTDSLYFMAPRPAGPHGAAPTPVPANTSPDSNNGRHSPLATPSTASYPKWHCAACRSTEDGGLSCNAGGLPASYMPTTPDAHHDPHQTGHNSNKKAHIPF